MNCYEIAGKIGNNGPDKVEMVNHNKVNDAKLNINDTKILRDETKGPRTGQLCK